MPQPPSNAPTLPTTPHLRLEESPPLQPSLSSGLTVEVERHLHMAYEPWGMRSDTTSPSSAPAPTASLVSPKPLCGAAALSLHQHARHATCTPFIGAVLPAPGRRHSRSHQTHSQGVEPRVAANMLMPPLVPRTTAPAPRTVHRMHVHAAVSLDLPAASVPDNSSDATTATSMRSMALGLPPHSDSASWDGSTAIRQREAAAAPSAVLHVPRTSPGAARLSRRPQSPRQPEAATFAGACTPASGRIEAPAQPDVHVDEVGSLAERASPGSGASRADDLVSSPVLAERADGDAEEPRCRHTGEVFAARVVGSPCTLESLHDVEPALLSRRQLTPPPLWQGAPPSPPDTSPLTLAVHDAVASPVRRGAHAGAHDSRAPAGQPCRVLDLSLFTACRAGFAEGVRVLLRRGAHVHAQDAHGMTPLLLACAGGHTPVVDTLLQAGADPDVRRPRDGASALMVAAEAAADGVARRLVCEGAGVKASAHMGLTCMHFAVIGGCVRIAQRLVRAGAPLNGRSSRGATPLAVAAGQGHAQMVAALLHGGADASVRDLEGQTPADVALRTGHVGVLWQLWGAGVAMEWHPCACGC